MVARLMPLVVGLVALALAACGDANSLPTATQEPIVIDSQTQGIPTPTPTPLLPGSITPTPASENHRLSLGDGVVVAFVEGLSPELGGKVAYVTHVPSGTQAVLDRVGQIVDRHDGRDDGPDRLDAVLSDEAAMRRIMEGLKNDVEVRARQIDILWNDSIWFGSITCRAKYNLGGDRVLTFGDLGPELYRVAFRVADHPGSNYGFQDGDATLENPGTPVYAVKGYAPEFRLGISDGRNVRVYEADMNPMAKVGEDLLDIRGKVTTINILSEHDGRTLLDTIDEESTVESLVEAVLGSPVDQEARDHEVTCVDVQRLCPPKWSGKMSI